MRAAAQQLAGLLRALRCLEVAEKRLVTLTPPSPWLPGAAASPRGAPSPLVGALASATRAFRGSAAAAADAAPPAGLNPLSQAPPPPGAAAAASPAGAAPAAAGGPRLARAVLRGAAISPRKLNDFARVLRGLPLEDALLQCAARARSKKAAALADKVVRSAAANAVANHGLDAARLSVAEAYVGRGSHLKRTAIHGRGRSARLLKYRAHLTVVLAEGDAPPRRRTRVVPMLAERARWRSKFDGAAAAGGGGDSGGSGGAGGAAL